MSRLADGRASERCEREATRLATLDRLDAVRPETDHVLQELVGEVRGIFGADLCLVNLALSDTLYFRVWSGDLPVDLAWHRKGPLEEMVCRHVVEAEAPLVVPDFLAAEEYRDEPVCASYGIRSYAGTPLITSSGDTIGTLCLLSEQPAKLGEDSVSLLAAFARAVVGRLELLGALGREKAAREREARRVLELRRTLDASRDIIATLGVDGVYRTISRACKTILGFEPEEMIGRHFLEFVHPDDRDAETKRFAGAVEGGAAPTFENRCLRKDGGVVWGEVSAVCVPEEGVLHCVVRDVTGRKRAEDAVARQARQAALRAGVSAALAAGGDLPGVLRLCTDALVRNLGAAFARIWTADEEEGVLRLRASSGEYTHLDGPHARVPFGEPKIGRVAREREAHLTNDVANDPRVGDRGWARREGMAAFAGHPLVVEDRLVGVVAMFSREPLSKDAAEALASVADAIAQGIERKRAERALIDNEHRLRQIFERSADALLVHDETGRIVDCNSEAHRSLGYSREELLSLCVKDFATNLLSDDEKRSRRGDTLWRRALEGEPGQRALGGVHLGEHRRKDGSTFPVEVRVGRVAYGGERMVLASVRDITERVRAEEALRESEARHRAVIETAFDAIVTATPDGIIRSFNPSAERTFGYTAPEVIGEPLTLLMPERFRVMHTAGMQRYLETGEARVLGRTVRLEGRRKDGAEFPIEITVVEMGGEKGALFTATIRDITERKAFEERLERQAFHDALTGLPNRTLFTNRLEGALARVARRAEGGVAVLFLDLDNFKVVNDSLGHEDGDRLLVAVSERLLGCLRPGDTLARFGGDEFTVLLEDVRDAEDATRVAERIAGELAAPFTVRGHELCVTTSIGISYAASGRSRPDELLRNADMAMYRAKSKGRTRYEVYDPRMRSRALKRLELEKELRRAIERDEFRIYYQPQVSLGAGPRRGSGFAGGPAVEGVPRISGMEALVRWEHPERGVVSPGEFIPVAEETGLIVAIGQRVLREACRQAREWLELYPDSRPLTMSVNLSPCQFRRPNLVQDVARVLRETGLDPRVLQLEITESVMMEDTEANAAMLQKLKALGVRLGIDDFGKGYSSLSYLKRLPVDFLKIDRSFVAGLGQDSWDAAIVQAAITLSHTLGSTVVGEGVETAEQLAQLRRLGCDYAQGFYFARPLPVEAASALLATGLAGSPAGDVSLTAGTRADAS